MGGNKLSLISLKVWGFAMVWLGWLTILFPFFFFDFISLSIYLIYDRISNRDIKSKKKNGKPMVRSTDHTMAKPQTLREIKRSLSPPLFYSLTTPYWLHAVCIFWCSGPVCDSCIYNLHLKYNVWIFLLALLIWEVVSKCLADVWNTDPKSPSRFDTFFSDHGH